ncbi:MAG: hypothetical protein R3D00_20155 [Bacteroidia bacterium]
MYRIDPVHSVRIRIHLVIFQVQYFLFWSYQLYDLFQSTNKHIMSQIHFSHTVFTAIKICIGSLVVAGKLLLMLPALLMDK